MDRKKIIKELKEYKKKIAKKIKIDKMILFGSRAKGRYRKDSDVDLIVVSPNFRKKRFVKRPFILYKEWDLDYPTDILCYTPKEFAKMNKKINIVSQALKEGVVI